MATAHEKRIKQELRKVGVTSYGLLKQESRYLPSIIAEDEHIGGAIYGQSNGSSVMIVATDKRIIYLDKKPFYTTLDELTYDVVSGIRSDKAAAFASVVLYTRVANYTVRYTNPVCASTFIKYLENKRINKNLTDITNGTTSSVAELVDQSEKTDEAFKFLRTKDLAVLSTISRTGTVHGATVYYAIDKQNFIYILTRSGTNKSRDVLANGDVALTIYDEQNLETVQLEGKAEIVTDPDIKQAVFDQMFKEKDYKGTKKLPPVFKIKNGGAYMVIKVHPISIKYRNFS